MAGCTQDRQNSRRQPDQEAVGMGPQVPKQSRQGRPREPAALNYEIEKREKRIKVKKKDM